MIEIWEIDWVKNLFIFYSLIYTQNFKIRLDSFFKKILLIEYK